MLYLGLFLAVVMIALWIAMRTTAARRPGSGGGGFGGGRDTSSTNTTDDDYWMRQRHFDNTNATPADEPVHSSHHSHDSGSGHDMGVSMGEETAHVAMDFSSSDSGSSWSDSSSSSDSGSSDSGSWSSD